MTTILDLVRGLPATESELRARKDEFNTEVAVRVMGFPPDGTVFPFDYMYDIGHAKAATEVLVKRGWRLDVRWMCVDRDNDQQEIFAWDVALRKFIKGHWMSADVTASTEELARSAACLLAAAKEKP